MGFFDFITKGPIGGIIKTLAPVVANAIPVVGPVINAALPALDGILSHDSTKAPDFSKPPPPPDQQVSSFKLDDVLKPITTQFQATDSLIKGVQESVNNLSSEMQKGFASVDSHIDKAIEAAEKKQEIRDDHKANIALVNKITIAQKWLDNNKTALSQITPNSGEAKFNQFLKAGEPDNLPTTRKELYDEVMIPLQRQLATRPYLETVDTYLLALHWLLILDKA
ncbi:MAG: hypothetical protein M1836_006411 [Candelina mexicana]|nr:MAG: hypothetical protein M1836_006411 [Candelina mexicana]